MREWIEAGRQGNEGGKGAKELGSEGGERERGKETGREGNLE